MSSIPFNSSLQSLSHTWLTSVRRITSGKRIDGLSCFHSLSHPLIISILFRLPKIKAWIDTNNPGDPLIPFSVALEERLLKLSGEDQEAELKSLGTQSALGKITQAGYSSLDVRATPYMHNVDLIPFQS